MATFVDTKGTVAASAASVTPTMPTGWAAGDLVFIAILGKYRSADVDTPAGWTSITGRIQHSITTTGTDVGNVFAKVYGRIMQAGDTAPTFTATATVNSWVTIAEAWRPDAGNAFADAADLTLVPWQSFDDAITADPLTGSATFTTQPAAASGAQLSLFGVIPTDSGTVQGAVTASAPGLAGGTVAARNYSENALGADCAGLSWTWIGFTGTATGALSWSTAITSSTNSVGVGVALWIRESSSSVTGTLAVTLDGTTLAASGLVANPVSGTLAVTLEDATLAAGGGETFTGTLATTLADTALAGSGAVANPVSGTLTVTLDDTTLSSGGSEGFIGTLASTLADTTLAGAGGETFTGTLAATLDDSTLAAAGAVANPVSGTLATTLDDATLTASGGETFSGALAATLADTTLAASGVAGGAQGTLAVALDDATLQAAGGEAFVGDLTITLDDTTIAVVGVVANPVTGTLSVILDDTALQASGSETFTGTLTVTLEDATFSADGTETIEATLVVTLDDTTLAASGAMTPGALLIPELVLTVRVLPRKLASPVHTRALAARVLPRRLESD